MGTKVGQTPPAGRRGEGMQFDRGDLIDMGVLDPTKVTRLALQNASSVAGLLLTTEVMVAEAPKEEEHKHGGGMPDMGGMGDMGM